MSTIKLAGLKLTDLKETTHEKYGTSYVLENPTVELEGKLYKINTFKTFVKEVVQTSNGPREVSITTHSLSLRPIAASVPTAPTENPSKRTKGQKAPTFEDFMAWQAAQSAGSK